MHEIVPDTVHRGVALSPFRLRIGSRVGDGRLHVLETLGRGGMGVVYQAFDAVRRCPVALKTMNRVDAVGIYSLKNEFRALTDVNHPNLVRLFELYREEDTWFFTMELVRGERFDRWVRPQGRLDESRLRDAFAQLLDGIDAVHAAGKLHRDIKPSNVLVTSEGHVVVLDFGLVTEPHAQAIGQTVSDGSLVGTPAYLAPELVLGSRATAATDLYALGVMLFEALAGRLPFEGSAIELLIAKQESVPVWPESIRRSAPLDLVELCDRLLAREPATRPDMAALRNQFVNSRRETTIGPASSPPPPLQAADLLGRESELDRLRAAYSASAAGRAVAVFVSGESGIGKTAVCSALLDELAREGRAVVLRGRCNERESVPFKALDSLVDDLSRHLRRLRPEQAAAVMPRDAAALTILFPALARVDQFADAPVRPAADPHEQLRRAFEAFYELLARLRDRTPLIIHIDDLQWTDRDSTQLLRHLLLHAEATPALMVFSHRSERAGRNELLDIVMDAAQANREITLERILLEPLEQHASSLLAKRWLAGTHTAQAGEMSERIEREAHGNPFLIGEFARFVALAGEIDSENLSLHIVLDARLTTVSAPARKLLSLLTLAGQAMATDLLLSAAGATHADIDALQAAHLIRSSGQTRIEFYHDRIRERLCESIAPGDAREHYAELARACAGRSEVEIDMRCAYLEGAGNTAEAAACAASAADQAAAALAFDRAARLYEKALNLGAFTPTTGLRLTRGLAQALENAGRSVESAAAYQRAALLAQGDDELDLRRRAAAQLLAAGHATEGLAALELVCDDIGLSLPTKTKLGNLSLAWSLGKLRLAAPGAKQRSLAVTPAERRRSLRLDVFQTAIAGLQAYSQVSAAQLALEYVREAQRAGDVRHLVWALGSLGMLVSSRSLYPELLAQMEAIAVRDGRPELRGLAYGLRGFVAGRAAQHREARASFAKALAAYSDCVGMQWQIDLVHVFDQLSASSNAEYPELARTTPVLSDTAFQQGRAWTGAMLSGFWGMAAWLAHDDATGYRRQLERARSSWGHHAAVLTSDRASYGLHRAEVMLSIYEGNPLHGRELLARRANTPMKPTHRRDHGYLRRMCCVAALGGARAGRIRIADRAAMRDEARPTPELRRTPQIRANAHAIDAALAIDEGRLGLAERELRAAAELFELASTPMLVAGTRRRLGQLIGGDEGRALVIAAETFMESRQVRNLEAFNELICPGCAFG